MAISMVRCCLRKRLPPSTAKKQPRSLSYADSAFLARPCPAYVASLEVFGRSWLGPGYGHFHCWLLLCAPLPPFTAKNSLHRSSRLILLLHPSLRHRIHPFMQDPLPRGPGIVFAKFLFSDVKGKRIGPPPLPVIAPARE